MSNSVTHNGAPDRFLLCSGGMDSVAMTHKMWNEFEDEQKNPVVVYFQTTIGLPSQRLYVQMLCDEYRWPLIIHRTEENFEDISVKRHFYSPNSHGDIFAKLKGRQKQKLITISGNPHFYWGVYQAESQKRKKSVVPKKEGERGAVHHAPIWDKDKEWVEEYVKEHELPFNPNWTINHCTDCCCGATASREELYELEKEGYQVMARKIRRIEEKVDADGKTGTWAWGSFSDRVLKEMDAQASEAQSDLSDWGCGDNCTSATLDIELPDRECPECGADVPLRTL